MLEELWNVNFMPYGKAGNVNLANAKHALQQINYNLRMSSKYIARSLRKMMFLPPPTVVLVALLLFTVIHLGIFHPQVLHLAYKCQNIGGSCSRILPTAFNHGASSGKPQSPDTLSPKIRQVSMRVYSANNETKKAINERCMTSHLDYGKRWGYPTHILREVVMGKEQWMDLLFNKPLYIIIAEMAKPADERAEWLV